MGTPDPASHRHKFYIVSGIGMTNSSSVPVLVLIHAFPMGAGLWAAQRDAFPGWRVLTPSMPGFDGRPRLASPSMDTYADAILEVVADAGPQPFVLGGVSMGGYLTFAIMRRAPGRVRALILAHTRSIADSDETRAGRQRMFDLIASGGAAAVTADMLPKLLGSTTRASRPAVVESLRRLCEAQDADGLADATRAMMSRPDSTPMLPRIDVPTLVVLGEEDTLTPPPEAERMAAALPRATLVRLPAAGHLSNMETPGAFNEVVGRFLAGL
jgi:pimeloyl-ACP methyl ester carboxylesterase